MHSTIEGEDKHVESRLIPRLDESSNLSTGSGNCGDAAAVSYALEQKQKEWR